MRVLYLQTKYMHIKYSSFYVSFCDEPFLLFHIF